VFVSGQSACGCEQSRIEVRNDVLVCSTDPLKQGLEFGSPLFQSLLG